MQQPEMMMQKAGEEQIVGGISVFSFNKTNYDFCGKGTAAAREHF